MAHRYSSIKADIRVAQKSKALGMEQGHRLICVELKSRVGTVSKEQKARHKVMADFGFPVYVV